MPRTTSIRFDRTPICDIHRHRAAATATAKYQPTTVAQPRADKMPGPNTGVPNHREFLLEKNLRVFFGWINWYHSSTDSNREIVDVLFSAKNHLDSFSPFDIARHTVPELLTILGL